MDAGLFAQYAVIAVAVLASALFVAQKQWPAAMRRMRIACAVPLVRPARPSWVRSVGMRIAPAAMRGGAGCESDCGGCAK